MSLRYTYVFCRFVVPFTQIRTCILEKLLGFFLKIFCYKEKPYVASCDLTLLCADLVLSVLLLSRIVFTLKIQQFE